MAIFGIFDIFLFSILFLFLLYKLIYRLLGRFFYIKNWRKKSVFITGCDTGFGHFAALKFADWGLTVFAGCVTEEGQTSLRNERPEASNLHTVSLDVRDDQSVEKARKFVVENLQKKSEKLWAVINNAGITQTLAPDEWLSTDHYRSLMEINMYGYRRVVQAFLPSLKASRGRILLVASIRSRMVFPLAGPYTLSKYSVEAYADLIRRELRDFGVRVSVVEPGGYRTCISYFQNTVKNNIAELWNNLSPEIKAQYGEDYLRSIYYDCQNLADIQAEDLGPIIRAYSEAILSEFPRYRYVISWMCWRVFLPLSYMSEWIQDLWIDRVFMADKRIAGRKSKND